MGEIRALAQKIAAASERKASVFLFGSYARGEARPSSDVDLLVVENVEDELWDWAQEAVRLSDETLSDFRKSVDLIVMSRSNYLKWRNCPGTVQYEATKKGKCLVH